MQKLLSQYAVDIEVENTDDIQGLIEAIIKANNNLTQSNENQNWEMMGKDIQKLQTLINSLEEMENKEEKKKQNSNSTENTVNTIETNTNAKNNTNNNN